MIADTLASARELRDSGLSGPELLEAMANASSKRRFALSDMGNAERLAARFRGHVRYCYARRKWLLWQGTHWAWDEGAGIQELAKYVVRDIYEEAAACPSEKGRKAIAKHALASEKSGRISAMLTLAQSEPGIPVTLAELDADPWLLNCGNGTVDLRTGELRPHRPEDLITKTTGLDFDPDATSTLWDTVLTSATSGDTELAAYLQRVAGYACAGVATERRFFLLYGEPGTGKSTIIDGLQAALGDYAMATPFDTWLAHTNVGGNRGDLVRLAGTRLAVSAEVRKGARWDEAIVKQITGGDEIVAAAKFEAEVSFRAACTLVLAANDAPTARDDDAGFWARCQRIPFERVIPEAEQVRGLKDELRKPDNARAVLAWAVRGCLAWQAHGIGSCAAVERSTAAYRAESDRFGEFLEECMVVDPSDPTARITRKLLRAQYEQWAKEVGLRTLLSARQMRARLLERGVTETKYVGERMWVGVRLREEDDEHPGAV